MNPLAQLQKVIAETLKTNGSVAEKMSQIAPLLKTTADELVDVTTNLAGIEASVQKAVEDMKLQQVGRSWEDASTSRDEGVDTVFTNKVMTEKGYPTDRPLTDKEKEALKEDVKAAKAEFEVDMRERLGENMFEFGSAVKKGGYQAVQAIDSYMRMRDIYSTPTSTGNLTDLCDKIQKTVDSAIEATGKLGSAGQRVFKWLMHDNAGHNHSQSVLLHNIENIGLSRLGMGATALAGTAVGINSMVSAFKSGDIAGGIRTAGNAYGSVRSKWDASLAKRDKFFDDKEKMQVDADNGRHPFWKDAGTPAGGAAPIAPEALDISEEGETEEETSAVGSEYVSEISVLLDGKKAEGNSECVAGDTEYLLSDYQLSQSMLTPVRVSFTMIKKNVAEEDEKDVKYDVCKQIIGLDLEMTVRTNYSDMPDRPAGMFSFKGLVTGVSATRGAGGTPIIQVTASSYDYLLDGAPNCRTFENKTLEEIVSTVTGGVKNLKCRISPRLKSKIPYIVQYNQSDYDFLASLAVRFGEWMYHNGTEFVFGEIVAPSDGVVKMRYPSGNIFSHGVDLRLRDMNIVHVSSNLYEYGEEGIVRQSDSGLAERTTHELNDAAFERVKALYSSPTVYYPHAGGAFDDGSKEGTDELMLNSVKVVSRGKRAQMFISNGSSKVSGLFLGQQFQIEDGVENISTDKGEVNQHPLMVLSVTHTFELNQNYDNTFEALPPSCDYPPYGKADIFSQAYPQRATVVDNQDPQGLGRVRVQFPWQKVQDTEEEKMWTPWIRMAQSYGGFSKGAQFIPEVGEEVMVGFEMDNVERPYVMGALFNGTNDPDPDWKAKVVSGTANNIKAIRTRNGHTLQFSDEGEGGDIQIYDHGKNNYMIHLSTDGKFIRIEAKGNIEIVAGNDINMEAAKNIRIRAGENISVESGKDMDLSSEANMSISAEDNMQQQATDIFVEASDSLSQESGNSHVVKTKKLQEKASDTMSVDGGKLVEITASSVKVR